MVICLEQGADLHMAQLMPLPLTVSCFTKIKIGFTFLLPAHLGSPGKRAIKRVCFLWTEVQFAIWIWVKHASGGGMNGISPGEGAICGDISQPTEKGISCMWSIFSTFYSKWKHRHSFFVVSTVANCLQCFETVGWASGRASGL